METKIERVKRIEIRLALQDLNSDFCHHLDHGDIDGLVDLFCEDALYSHGDRVSHGIAEIRQLFQSRGSAVVRTSRHMQTGLRFNIESAVRASGTSVCMTFAANASAPVCSAILFLVADFIDEYTCCRDGRWRIQKRHIERIFIASDNGGPLGAK